MKTAIFVLFVVLLCAVISESTRTYSRRHVIKKRRCISLAKRVAQQDNIFDKKCKTSNGYLQNAFCRKFAYQMYCLVLKAEKIGCVRFDSSGGSDSGSDSGSYSDNSDSDSSDSDSSDSDSSDSDEDDTTTAMTTTTTEAMTTTTTEAMTTTTEATTTTTTPFPMEAACIDSGGQCELAADVNCTTVGSGVCDAPGGIVLCCDPATIVPIGNLPTIVPIGNLPIMYK